MDNTPAAAAPTTLRDLGFCEIGEVSTLVGAKPLTLRNWRATGVGPPYTKIHGNRIVYPLDGLQKWLLARTVQPAASQRSMIHGKSKRRGTAS